MITHFKCNGWSSFDDGIALDFPFDKQDSNNNEGYSDKPKPMGIFGSNGAGKTNILQSINSIRLMILGEIEAFFLADHIGINNDNGVIDYSIDFSIDDNTYNYSLVIKPRENRITSESLKITSHSKQEMIFERSNLKVDTAIKTRGSVEIEEEYSGTSFFKYQNSKNLSKFASDDNNHVSKVLKMFTHDFITGKCEPPYSKDTLSKLSTLMKHFDTGIQRIEILEHKCSDKISYHDEILLKNEGADTSPYDDTDPIHPRCFKIYHDGIDQSFEYYEESDGTIKLIWLSLLLIKHDNCILLIDEFDRLLHPNIAIELLRLFSSKNIQLIFTSHESNWLSEKSCGNAIMS